MSSPSSSIFSKHGEKFVPPPPSNSGGSSNKALRSSHSNTFRTSVSQPMQIILDGWVSLATATISDQNCCSSASDTDPLMSTQIAMVPQDSLYIDGRYSSSPMYARCGLRHVYSSRTVFVKNGQRT